MVPRDLPPCVVVAAHVAIHDSLACRGGGRQTHPDTFSRERIHVAGGIANQKGATAPDAPTAHAEWPRTAHRRGWRMQPRFHLRERIKEALEQPPLNLGCLFGAIIIQHSDPHGIGSHRGYIELAVRRPVDLNMVTPWSDSEVLANRIPWATPPSLLFEQ